MPEILPTRVFTRSDPCTKVHIFNAFAVDPYGKGIVYRDLPVVESRGLIGLNVPKYLRREGYAEIVAIKHVEYYRLTPQGQQWLRDGLARHLELHPQDAAHLLLFTQVTGKPRAAVKPTRIVRKAR